MFSLCLKKMRKAMIIESKIKFKEQLKQYPEIGKAITAVRELIETILVVTVTIIKMPNERNERQGASAKKTPREVATPFPP